jgi:hypothetical protein
MTLSTAAEVGGRVSDSTFGTSSQFILHRFKFSTADTAEFT